MADTAPIGKGELRRLRTSPLWDELDEPAQTALLQLLAREIADEQTFLTEVQVIWRQHASFRRVLRKYLADRGTTERAVPEQAQPEPDTDAAVVPQDLAGAAPPDRRYLNLSLTWPISRQVVPHDWQLGAGAHYHLRLDIGDLGRDSLLRDSARPLPDDALPHRDDGGRGDWLQITVLSEDFLVPDRRHAMFLPLDGHAYVCPCPPGGRHVCRPEHRGRYVWIPVTAPDGPRSEASLRVTVAYRGNLLQSATVVARVAEREHSAGGSLRGEVDFTLTSGFLGLEDLPSRDAAIRVSRGYDGALVVDVDGGDRPVSTFWLTEAQIEGALARARTVLTDVHATRAVPPEKPGDTAIPPLDRLGPDNTKNPEEFRDDLWRLAAVGWDLLHLLAPVPAQRAALRDRLREPATIQICRQQGQPLMFPWALVYDIPVDTGDSPVYCESGLEQARHGDGAGRACPDSVRHTRNTVCPYGFWGFRHAIEQPTSRKDRGTLPLWAGRGLGAPHMTVGRALTLPRADLTERHLLSLRQQFGAANVRDCDSRESLLDELFRAGQDCVYFYCHGRRQKDAADRTGATELEIGDGERVRPADISARMTETTGTTETPGTTGTTGTTETTGATGTKGWRDWEENAPLVFLNGCHTTDDTPGTWLTFVDVFSSLGASGVIGTEISVGQNFAGEVAQSFWRHFLAGLTVGESLHRVRAELLGKGNLLGLAYTAYCCADLRLSRP
ncbi:CHAT domain-containing protein [Streptomyces sp. MK7]|uniref:CHAT domain-containing protein n=1 Tax=Streptomyces sp. MK7 TaxID=3067635 RepID=UPI002930BAF5|nr:CHAT domain-containing protein [Streptomyces sp. MK7]